MPCSRTDPADLKVGIVELQLMIIHLRDAENAVRITFFLRELGDSAVKLHGVDASEKSPDRTLRSPSRSRLDISMSLDIIISYRK